MSDAQLLVARPFKQRVESLRRFESGLAHLRSSPSGVGAGEAPYPLRSAFLRGDREPPKSASADPAACLAEPSARGIRTSRCCVVGPCREGSRRPDCPSGREQILALAWQTRLDHGAPTGLWEVAVPHS